MDLRCEQPVESMSLEERCALAFNIIESAYRTPAVDVNGLALRLVEVLGVVARILDPVKAAELARAKTFFGFFRSSETAHCRVCGCTEDNACPGGCYWVEDPEGLGDLCSACLAKPPGSAGKEGLGKMVEIGQSPESLSDATIVHLRQELKKATERIEYLEQRICDECQDENGYPTGWKENRVEGRHPCTCMTEAEPYQVLMDENDFLREQLAEKDRAIKQMRAGLLAVETLINESRGVCGLHLNGDEAPWEELRSGGRFEQWLYKLDEALDLIKRDNPGSAGNKKEDPV